MGSRRFGKVRCGHIFSSRIPIARRLLGRSRSISTWKNACRNHDSVIIIMAHQLKMWGWGQKPV